ncbi:hypothetical protein B0H13DRAFT_2363312 [Mycena leptocephala]|nr:hypothetical protein B0H13DRAFT_2363312 [Mycena leptocephala]
MFHLGGKNLKQVQKACYLGIWLETGTKTIFREHYKVKAKKATVVANVILELDRFVGHIPAWDARTLYMARVDPYLASGCVPGSSSTIRTSAGAEGDAQSEGLGAHPPSLLCPFAVVDSFPSSPHTSLRTPQGTRNAQGAHSFPSSSLSPPLHYTYTAVCASDPLSERDAPGRSSLLCPQRVGDLCMRSCLVVQVGLRRTQSRADGLRAKRDDERRARACIPLCNLHGSPAGRSALRTTSKPVRLAHLQHSALPLGIRAALPPDTRAALAARRANDAALAGRTIHSSAGTIHQASGLHRDTLPRARCRPRCRRVRLNAEGIIVF